MIYNVLIDVIFGVIPVIGDIFDFTWKANTKNIKLIHDDINTNNLRPRECSQSIIILILISIISFAFVLAVPTFIMIKLFEALFN